MSIYVQQRDVRNQTGMMQITAHWKAIALLLHVRLDVCLNGSVYKLFHSFPMLRYTSGRDLVEIDGRLCFGEL